MSRHTCTAHACDMLYAYPSDRYERVLIYESGAIERQTSAESRLKLMAPYQMDPSLGKADSLFPLVFQFETNLVE